MITSCVKKYCIIFISLTRRKYEYSYSRKFANDRETINIGNRIYSPDIKYSQFEDIQSDGQLNFYFLVDLAVS